MRGMSGLTDVAHVVGRFDHNFSTLWFRQSPNVSPLALVVLVSFVWESDWLAPTTVNLESPAL